MWGKPWGIREVFAGWTGLTLLHGSAPRIPSYPAVDDGFELGPAAGLGERDHLLVPWSGTYKEKPPPSEREGERDAKGPEGNQD